MKHPPTLALLAAPQGAVSRSGRPFPTDMPTALRRIETDILILGAGGAGLFAALHAHAANPALSITIAVKGLLGKCGCTRMVQGGYNVALAPGDSVERHFMDTIVGGAWLPNQDLAWTLVNGAIERIHELENELGCFFDRNPDGTIHQKAFAGQTFDRTVHKGDLTGIEIINRLAEQVWARGIDRLEEHRALAFVPSADGKTLAGVVLVDVRDGAYVYVAAKAVLLGTGGGPTMYRYHTPSGDKSCDGLAMALAAGLPLRDMEMVQFHPDRPARGRTHAHDRHGARRRTARCGRLPARRRAASASCRTTMPAASAPRAISFRGPSTRRCAPGARRRTVACGWRWRISVPTMCAASSRAWSSAVPIAASIWRADASRSCRPRTT